VEKDYENKIPKNDPLAGDYGGSTHHPWLRTYDQFGQSWLITNRISIR
jgi:hypothetical protein